MPESDILEPPVTDKTFLKLIQAIQTVSIKSAVVDNTDTESSTKALSAGQGFKLQREVDADRGENSAYDPTATYDVGEFCINDNALYKCNTAISTPEAWDASHWDAVNLKGLDMSVTSLSDVVDGIQWKLVWTNPDTTVNFNQQTAQFDISEYRYIMIVFKELTTSNNRFATIFPLDGSRFICDSLRWTGAYGIPYMRSVYADTNGLAISTGYYLGANNYATVADNSVAIPVNIYASK